jgi:hypothetical protein
MRQANDAIKRVRHLIPTVEDISLELNGAQWFSKLDLSQAYHQLELDEASRYITTFSTHIGLFRYKRPNTVPTLPQKSSSTPYNNNYKIYLV